MVARVRVRPGGSWLGAAGGASAEALPLRDARGAAITDEEQLERIAALAVPPAWTDVWISPSPRARCRQPGSTRPAASSTATTTAIGQPRSARSSSACSTSASRCPACAGRGAVISGSGRTSAIGPARSPSALINKAWFRVGSEQHARSSRTYGVTTFRKRHVAVERRRDRVPLPREEPQARAGDRSERGPRRRRRGAPGASRWLAPLPLRARRRARATLSSATSERLPRGESRRRVSRPRTSGRGAGRCSRRQELESCGPAETEAEAKRALAAVMRHVGEELGNTARLRAPPT